MGDRLGDEVLPGLGRGDAAADFGGGDFVEGGRCVERVQGMAQMRGHVEFAVPRCDQKMKFLEQLLDGTERAVIPRQNALGGIASANEVDLVAGALELARDFDVQAPSGVLDAIESSRGGEHGRALIERRSVKCLVGQGLRKHGDHFIDHGSGGFGEPGVGACYGIKRPGENPDFHRGSFFIADP